MRGERLFGSTALAIGLVCLSAAPAEAAFPGANGRIAFTRSGDVYTMGPDGSGQVNLTNTGSASTGPAWSPDGRRLAYSSTLPCCFDSEIHVMNADGTGDLALTSNGSDDFSPAWSPDGSRIAFVSNRACCSGNTDLFVMNSDGTDQTNLTSTQTVSEDQPAWSPIGTTIAFVPDNACCSGNRDIYLMNSDGSGRADLTNTTNANEERPSWSPDAGSVVFESDLGSPGIDIMGVDGSARRKLSATPFAVDSQPAWSPDSTEVAFRSDRDGNGEIYTVGRDGGPQTRLTTNPSGDAEPDWQPLGGLDPFPRPGGATPLRVPLVPAYLECLAPNSSHAPPLDFASCTPPAQESSELTTGAIGQGTAYARYLVQVGDPSTPADEADIGISATATDVRRKLDGSDYAGQVILVTDIRIADRAHGAGGVSGTAQDARFGVPVSCVAVSGPVGGTCTVATTADTLAPGFAKEGKRAVISTFSIVLKDAGPDGMVAGASCPFACGTGDERVFLRQGVFTP